MHVWGYWYFSQQSWFLIPACATSSLACLMIYSAYKLNKQGDNILPWHGPQELTIYLKLPHVRKGFLGGSTDKEPACQCRKHRRLGFSPSVGKVPWRRKLQPIHFSCVGNSIDRGTWWAVVYGVTESQTQLQNGTHAHDPLSACKMEILTIL